MEDNFRLSVYCSCLAILNSILSVIENSNLQIFNQIVFILYRGSVFGWYLTTLTATFPMEYFGRLYGLGTVRLLTKNQSLNLFKTLSALIAPIVRPLEAWATSSVNENGITSYTTVFCFLIFLGAITFFHLIVLIKDKSTFLPINITETSDISKPGTDSTENSEDYKVNSSSA